MKATVSVVANAIRKNGYKQAFGVYVERDSYNKVKSACALGQAGLNLGIEGERLYRALQSIKSPTGNQLGTWITLLNDDDRLTLDQIADAIERDWADRLSETVSV